jgi:benzylsuccinate CoA-transferase BbsE subunit
VIQREGNKLLSGYRALDLTDRKGFFCGKILAELGVDVIKIEKPGGDPARNVGPFYKDDINPEKSLYWFAYNESKRGITLNIEVPKGQEIFKKLAETADFVIESFPVGYMLELGLAYQQLKKINRRIIVTSITPYGQSGEWRGWKGTDLTLMATGSIMILTGESDGVPVRLNPDHAYCLAGSNAALATLVAHYYRETSGLGQHVDVSIHECVVRENYHYLEAGQEIRGLPLPQRTGTRMMAAEGLYIHSIWPCKDGYVTWAFLGGAAGAPDNRRISQWMDDEGLPGGIPTDTDWENLDFSKIDQDYVDKMEDRVAKFFMKHSKHELEEEAVRRGVRIWAVNDMQDILNHKQLDFRRFFKNMEHPNLGATIKYPGYLFETTEGDKACIRFPAPLIGEHNKQIYQDELGLSGQEIKELKQSGVI